MTTTPNQHLQAFDFSVEFLQEMMTTGWEIGTKSIVRCVDGLPQNAQFEYAEFSSGSFVSLIFSHPTFPLVSDPCAITRSAITIRQVVRVDIAIPSECPTCRSTTYVCGACGRQVTP
jgi:hypothetical protein